MHLNFDFRGEGGKAVQLQLDGNSKEIADGIGEFLGTERGKRLIAELFLIQKSAKVVVDEGLLFRMLKRIEQLEDKMFPPIFEDGKDVP